MDVYPTYLSYVAASCTGGSQLSSVGNCLKAYSSAQPWYVARRNCYKKRSKLYTQSPSQDKDLYNYLKSKYEPI